MRLDAEKLDTLRRWGHGLETDDREIAAAHTAGVDASLPMPVALSLLAAEVSRLVARS